MSAEGIFVGLPRETLEGLRDAALEILTKGRVTMSYGDNVTNASKQFGMPPKEQLAEAMYALRRLDGRTRGLYTNYNRLVDR